MTPPPQLDFAELPKDPGVYLFRDDAGRVLYVGKSVSIRSRARAHFAPSTGPADWTVQASVVDYQSTNSELGALVLENRLIKQHRPPGNIRLARKDERLCYIRCRLDIAFPILEVASDPASGHAVTIGPLRGRKLAHELVEQLDSLFGLRHCGRKLVLREHPSAYGQMGRCLSPCLGDLDPNLYRRRLDEALGLFVGASRRPGAICWRTSERQMQAASEQQLYERAAWLRRRLRRLGVILERLGGGLEATHARARLLLAAHPVDAERKDAFWLVGGRLVDWGEAPPDTTRSRRGPKPRSSGAAAPQLGAHVPPTEIDELRIVSNYLASHPETTQLVRSRTGARRPRPSGPRGHQSATATCVPGGASRRTSASAIGPTRGESATLASRPTARPSNDQLSRPATPGRTAAALAAARFGLPR